MNSYLLSFIIFCLAAAGTNAQTIRGRVVQSDGQAVEYATITLHTTRDSALVKGAMTGDDGAFELTAVEPGRYFIRANQIGLGQGESAAFDFAGGEHTLDDLRIAATTTQLGTVTVTARRPVFEVKADKTIMNVEGTLNSTGLSALELLRKAPGVTVNQDDQIQVKGKNQVRIQIDGRDQPLDGKDLAAVLKGMQASDIASIEIISNPSAKFDAAGNAGIINIRLKKNRALGTNGNVTAELMYGKTAKAGSGISLNHRAEKFNVFGSYNNHFGDFASTQYFYREQSGYVFDQVADQGWGNRWQGARAGADWYVHPKHTVGMLVNSSYNFGDWTSASVARIGQLENAGRVDSILDATNLIDNDRFDVNANLNYRFADTLGRTLNIDADYGIYRIDGRADQPNFYRTADGGTLLSARHYRNHTPTNIDIATVKADYEQPLFKGTFGVGFKIANVETDNTFDFFNVVDGQDVKDLDVSNQFLYRERTTAGYVNYQHKFGPLHMQAGLRVENTDYRGDLIASTDQNGETVENNYTELFPSGALTYAISPKFGLNLTYSRRIDRPSYQDLNPFEFKLDELTYSKGNPMLRPQFTNSFELAPTFNGMPVVTFGYSHTKDVFTQMLDTTNRTATFQTQANIADQTNYTVTLNAPTPIAKWWDGFVSVTAFRSRFSASFRENFTFDQSFTAFNAFAEQNIRLPKQFTVQLSGWYNSRAFWGTLRSNPQGAMDVAIAKKVWDGRGEFKLRLGDVLGTAGWGGENVFTPGLRMTARGNWESQFAALNFSYRFGSNEVKGARQRKTGLEEEGRRVKSGN